MLLHRRKIFSVSSSTQKVVTFNRDGWGTFVHPGSTDKSAEPPPSRHLLRMTYPMFQGPWFPSQDSNLSITDLLKSLLSTLVAIYYSCVCFPIAEDKGLCESKEVLQLSYLGFNCLLLALIFSLSLCIATHCNLVIASQLHSPYKLFLSQLSNA